MEKRNPVLILVVMEYTQWEGVGAAYGEWEYLS